MHTHKLSLNLSKTKVMFFGTHAKLPKIEDISVKLGDSTVDSVTVFKYLGITLDSRLTFSQHVEVIRKKSIPKMTTIARISQYVNEETIVYLYKSLILSQIKYGDIIYDGLSDKDSQFLQRLQNKCLKTLLHLDPLTSTVDVHVIAGIKTLKEGRVDHVCVQVYKGLNQLSTEVVNQMFTHVGTENDRITRSCTRQDLVPNSRLQINRRSIAYRGPVYYNNLPVETRQAPTLSTFKEMLAHNGERDTG